MTKYTSEEIQEHRRLWLEALRSGKYTQGRMRLATTYGDDIPVRYCCLGVACDVAIKSGLDLDVAKVDGGAALTFDGGSRVLPDRVQEWLGLEDRSPELRSTSEMMSLVGLNDSGDYTFEEIADLIEKHGFLGDMIAQP